MLGSQVRLVALDLDGTFLDNHHQISAANAKAVEILRQHGVRIALVTGRRFRNVARIVRQYGLGDLMIVHNGALVRNCDTEELIYFQELERAVCRDIIGASRWLQQSPFVLVDPLQTRVFFESQACENQARSQYLARNAGDSFGVADLTEVLTAGPVIQLLFTDAILALQECKTHLMDQFGDRATILETTYPERDHVFVDVIHASCSKGKTLQWLMRREHLLPRQVMAFGDNHNDLEMLEIAGHSFLMDNAAEDLKRLGFRIAPRNDADGVARVIHEYWK